MKKKGFWPIDDADGRGSKGWCESKAESECKQMMKDEHEQSIIGNNLEIAFTVTLSSISILFF